jgi:hypothetical protein
MLSEDERRGRINELEPYERDDADEQQTSAISNDFGQR